MARRMEASSTAGRGLVARGAARLSQFFPRLNLRRMAIIVRKELLVLL